MNKDMVTAMAFAFGMAKEAKNRLAKAIDAAKTVAPGGNAYHAARSVARLQNIQKATTQAAPAAAGRFKNVHDTIKAMPKLKPAALGLLKEKRL